MKTLQIDVPDQLALEVEAAVRQGAFGDVGEVVRAALRDFISGRRFELQEQQQLEDIAWALREKPVKSTSGAAATVQKAKAGLAIHAPNKLVSK
ncbi:hypothetical protein LBMAG56_15850 [Verrucomicrobiota bacterium]|nr:hypothetical protein LBMAG56_15850 [Verrucomicrobiota bacterium]